MIEEEDWGGERKRNSKQTLTFTFENQTGFGNLQSLKGERLQQIDRFARERVEE